MQSQTSKDKNIKLSGFIKVKGAREHNLKNIDISIPRQAITVVTGVSGSGKSSLVFDTILAESQRRFFYTLSHYSRQFLELSSRPEVSALEGLSPAIGIEQNETQPSRKASVGTQTDLGELIAVMFARFGLRLCPTHGLPTTAISVEEMAQNLLSKYNNLLIAVSAPLVEKKKGNFRSVLEKIRDKGYLRALIDETVVSLQKIPNLEKQEKHTIKIVVDYIRIDEKSKARLLRGLNSALEESKGYVECFLADEKGNFKPDILVRYSLKAGCSQCHYSWPNLDARYFSANSLGKCQTCDGYGYLKQTPSSINDEEEEEVSDTLPCHKCQTTGINTIYSFVQIESKTVHNCHRMDLSALKGFIYSLQQASIIKNLAFIRLREEILERLERLESMGLSYLQLGRRIRTLSGGELQRLKLANVLAENLRGVLYILDEPSQGLHPSELNILIKNLYKLRDQGNTIVLVDHDPDLISYADWLIDMGPGGGRDGGHVVASFAPHKAREFADKSVTAALMSAKQRIYLQPDLTALPSDLSSDFLILKGANRFNLNIPQVKFWKGKLNVVTGVSGAGKSSLVLHTLYPVCEALINKKSHSAAGLKKLQKDYQFENISGHNDFNFVDLVDRRPLAKSNVSMPATYLDVFTYIRQIFEKLPSSQILGLTSRDFSLHVNGGRCETCSGKGQILLSMKFLPDARVTCTVCQGKRYQKQILNLTYSGLNMADILDLTIEEVCEVFKNHAQIIKRLQPAVELGLGYLKLGQPSLSLSGGEAQRLKLVPSMSKITRSQAKTRLLILDEPTQGLHMQDTKLLLAALKKIVANGITVVIVEHSHQIIAASDWLIDLGPGSASQGGKLVYEGTPLRVVNQKQSITGQYFKDFLASAQAEG